MLHPHPRALCVHMLAEGAPHMDEGKYVEYVVYNVQVDAHPWVFTCGFGSPGT